MLARRLFLALCLVLAAASANAQIKWHDDLSDIDAVVARTGAKKILIDFTADWCGWCDKLDAETYPDKNVIAALSGYLCIKVNPEKDPLAARFADNLGLDGYPFLVLIDLEFEQIEHIGGFLDPAAFIKKVKSFDLAIAERQYLAMGRTGVAVGWETDPARALERAAAEKKLVLVDVWVDWCGWCDKLDSEVYTDAQVAELMKGFVCLKLNPETSKVAQEFLKPFPIQGYPTLLFLTSGKSKVDEIGGFLDAKAMKIRFEKVLAKKWY